MNSNFSVLFDMDGVLVDSVGCHWQAINEYLKINHNIVIKKNNIFKYIGRPLLDQVHQISFDFNIKISYKNLLNFVEKRSRDLMLNLLPKEGVLDLLHTLRDNNVKMAVATSNSRVEAKYRLRSAGILDYFNVLVTEEDVNKHKPDPEVYLKAAHLIDEKPARCLVIEDAPSGIQSANNAGMISVAVKTPYTKEDDLRIAKIVVPSLAKLNYDLIMGIMNEY